MTKITYKNGMERTNYGMFGCLDQSYYTESMSVIDYIDYLRTEKVEEIQGGTSDEDEQEKIQSAYDMGYNTLTNQIDKALTS